MIQIFKQNGNTSYGLKEYMIDTKAELSKIPTNIAMGSTVFIIEENKTYILNGNKEWIEKIAVSADETDPTVPNWAKQPNPPIYTPEDIGALSKEDIDQTYKSESENAQSGKAVAEAINNTINDIFLYVDEQVEANAKIIDLGYIDSLEKLKSLIPNLQVGKSYQFTFYDPEITNLGGVYVGSYIDMRNGFKGLAFHYPTDYSVIYKLSNSGDLYEYPVGIKDAGNYYTTKTVEGALQEIGATLNGLEALLVKI